MNAYESNLDIFESVFKRSVKHHYERESIALKKVLILADVDHVDTIKKFVDTYCNNTSEHIYNAQFQWLELKAELELEQPDLIVMQRQLGIPHRDLRFSLSPILECLTQEFKIPTLVLPHEMNGLKIETIGIGFDHQIDNSGLVNRSLMFGKHLKKMELIHVEDEAIFRYYMDAISKIAGINTEYAETNITETILHLSQSFSRMWLKT